MLGSLLGRWHLVVFQETADGDTVPFGMATKQAAPGLMAIGMDDAVQILDGDRRKQTARHAGHLAVLEIGRPPSNLHSKAAMSQSQVKGLCGHVMRSYCFLMRALLSMSAFAISVPAEAGEEAERRPL